MKIRSSNLPAKPLRSELLTALAYEGATPDLGKPLAPEVKRAKASGDLNTSRRKTSHFYPENGTTKRIAFVGMGKAGKMDLDGLRRTGAVAQAQAEKLGVERFHLLVDERDHRRISARQAAVALTEGLALGAYRYMPPRKEEPEARKAQEVEILYRGKNAREFHAGVKHGLITSEATIFARDIENMPGNLATPTHLAKQARGFSGGDLKVRILEEKEMEKLKMGALLGVSRGSVEPAKLILMDYNPRGAKRTICVVGKGLTFDSGGISIKPSAKMDEMRYDMCGGGAVLDAEGRLILADALAYAVKTYRPDKIVDLATLTGAVVVALGHEMAGVMGNDDDLIGELIAAGDATDEPVWELPLWEVHRKQIQSKFADIANINSGAHGNGSISGGAFLSYFVGDTPWAHMDIAGAAWGASNKDYYRTGAVGVSVRMLLQWLREQR
ncbi:MAG: leucyl aminopeptidase family protein [Planctomycetota bacterium]|jgi:leucyl aminopeptidase